MAMTADSSHTQSSGSSGGTDGLNSPLKQKTMPWSQVVSGDPESISPLILLTSDEQSNFSDCSPSPHKTVSSTVSLPAADSSNCTGTDGSESNSSNAAKLKKGAWKKPSNGVEVPPVMGAILWPALSESTKPYHKSSPPDSSSSKIVSDESPPTPQRPVIPHSPHKQAPSNAKSDHGMPTRQRSMKRGGGGSSSSAGGHPQSSFTLPPPPPPPPPFPVFAVPPNGYGNLVPAMPDQSPREPPYRGNNWEPRPVGGFVPQPPVANDHRHSPRRGNFGPRGDAPYHNNFGGRRDQNRGHYGNARDVPVQLQRSPRGFVRPPPQNAATAVPPQPMRPFGMGFPDLVYIPPFSMEPFRGVPFIAHAPTPAMIVPLPDPLPAKLVHQIEYYFSDANLIKDEYLKSNMDDQGWVPITLIAGFNRVKSMTKDIQLILDSLRTSTVLEVQDEKVRRRNDWMKWMPSSGRPPTDSGLQSFNLSSCDMLMNSFQKMTVEEVTAKQNSISVDPSPNAEDTLMRSSSELLAHIHLSQQEGTEDSSSS